MGVEFVCDGGGESVTFLAAMHDSCLVCKRCEGGVYEQGPEARRKQGPSSTWRLWDGLAGRVGELGKLGPCQLHLLLKPRKGGFEFPWSVWPVKDEDDKGKAGSHGCQLVHQVLKPEVGVCSREGGESASASEVVCE